MSCVRSLYRFVLALPLLGLGAGVFSADSSAPRPVAAAAAAAASLGAVEIGPIGFTVADLDRAAAFYTQVLSFVEDGPEAELEGGGRERLHGVFPLRARLRRLRLGDERIELTEYLAPRGRPFPDDTRGNDRWFQHIAIVVSDMERAYARLRSARVAHASSGPQRLPAWNPAAGGIVAFYFRDPDGHFLEVIAFPPGKGDPAWHRLKGASPERLFLGIDHTAITVADTEASLRFYRDRLGLRVVGESENHGPEQERLNAVHGARLRITTLRAERGPGVELLEYLAPGGGRPYPADAHANDVLHWQTTVRLGRLEAAPALLRPQESVWISPGIVNLERDPLGLAKALLLRDPDGHALLLIEG